MTEITFSCSADDEAWLKSQAEELGLDDVGMTVRVIVRDARKRGVGFGIVANGQQIVADRDPLPAKRTHYDWQLQRRVETVEKEANQRATEFPDPAPEVEVPIDVEPQDEVAAILAEGNSAVDAMLQQAPAIKPSPGYRKRADKWKAGASRPALQVVEGPGSRTSVVDAGELARLNPRELSPQDQVVQSNLLKQMDRHFGRRA